MQQIDHLLRINALFLPRHEAVVQRAYTRPRLFDGSVDEDESVGGELTLKALCVEGEEDEVSTIIMPGFPLEVCLEECTCLLARPEGLMNSVPDYDIADYLPLWQHGDYDMAVLERFSAAIGSNCAVPFF